MYTIWLMTHSLYATLHQKIVLCQKLTLTLVKLEFWLSEISCFNGQNIWPKPPAISATSWRTQNWRIYTMFTLRFLKWICYNFRYKHCRRKILYCHEALKMLYTMKKSASIGASMKEIWSFEFIQYISYGKAV